MKKSIKSNLFTAVAGLSVGIVNGLFGAGGGMLAVPVLKKSGLSQKEAHSNAIAVILPISILSTFLYLYKDYVHFSQALPYIPAGLLGAVIGTYLLKKISPLWLKRIFGLFMVYAGVRLLLK